MERFRYGSRFEKSLRPVPRSLDELFKNIVTSGEQGEERDLPGDMRDFLNLQGINVTSENQGIPDPNKLLIVTPNHHARKSILPRFTTLDSLNMVALSAVAAFDEGITNRHTAWIIKYLDKKRGPGSLARDVQNAAVTCYGQIPIKVEKRSEVNAESKKIIRDKIANLEEFQGLVLKNIMKPNNIGYFPEQKPSYELQPHDPNFPRFIRTLQRLPDAFQILPTSIHIEGKRAHVAFGQVVHVDASSDPLNVAGQTMKRIASNLPRKLRGAYS